MVKWSSVLCQVFSDLRDFLVTQADAKMNIKQTI